MINTLQCLLLQDVYSALNIRPSTPTQDSPPPLIHGGAVDTTIVHCAAPVTSGPSSDKAKEQV